MSSIKQNKKNTLDFHMPLGYKSTQNKVLPLISITIANKEPKRWLNVRKKEA